MKINDLTRQLKELKIRISRPKRDFTYFQRLRNTKVSVLKKKYDDRFIRYLFGLVHPDYVQENRMEVKQPTFLEIPSASVSFKEVFTFKPNTTGKFALVWLPNFLNTDQTKKYCHLKLINGEDYTGGSNYAQITYLNSYSPNISIRGYRLVSALLRIKYIGNVVDRAGMIYSCADYGVSNVLINDITNVYSSQTMVVNINEVRNGIWGTTTNITEGGVVEALFLPTDPTDQTFYPNGNYYGDEIVNVDIRGADDGARLTYKFAGTGLAVTNDSISVEVFYNFEVLPTPASAPIVKAGGNELNNEQVGVAQNLMSAVNSQKPIFTYIKKKIPNINSVVTRISSIAKTGASIAKIASALI